jgi:hypothetical protein
VFPPFLLLIIGAGCSDPDKAGNPGTTPPTVISVAPPDGSDGVCPNTIITATFSKAMNPATINDTTFVGNAEPTEERKNLAAERGVNSKAYLTGGESNPSRIEVRTGSGGTKTAEYWTVPAGATFSGEGTQRVDETKVKAVPDHPAHPAARAKKKAKATQ